MLHFSTLFTDQLTKLYLLVMTHFVMAFKTYFENFLGKFSEILAGCNVGEDYGCLCDLFFDFEEALSSFKFENFD